MDNNGERGFTVTRSTASSPGVTAYPNVYRGWQWEAGANGAWPVKVSGAGAPRAGFSVQQTWKGTCDASPGIWFSAYPNRTTQASGAEIMIFLSHPRVFTAGKKVRADGTDWYMNGRKAKGHGVTWPLIIFTHATQISRAARACASPISR